MSSLIPEHNIVISPSLATTIGLEEAVLLQILNQAASFARGEPRRGYQWFTLHSDELQQLLPFWDSRTLQRISASLSDKGIILIDSTTLQRGDTLCFAMNESSRQSSPYTPEATEAAQYPQNARAAMARPAQTNPPKAAGLASRNTARPAPRSTPSRVRGAALLAESWQPDEDLLQLLALNHNISRDFALQQREDFVLYWRDRQQVSHSWPSKFRQHVLKEWRFHQSRQAASAHTQEIQELQEQWRPSPDALEILLRNDVNQGFIEDAIPEFVLYWRERGEASSTWNSKFIAHIRRQWAKYTSALELDYEPRAIAADWQPNEDVYDILRLANIDISFARELVKEFVLFWRDTKQIQRSWNTKFLQHSKYQWATRHKMEQHYAGQQVDHQPGRARDGSLINRLTDRSWAEGLIESS